jgi:acyl-CoA synthetase (AMP-forming)/AMP-acid ligase II
MPVETILDLVQRQADQLGSATALQAPGRAELSYRRLADHVTHTASVLAGFGIRRRDPVAVVLPNGPDMAAAFLAVASAGICAPLNPNYRAPEYEFYLSDLKARALIAQENESSAVVEVAQKLRIPLISLRSLDEAGLFSLHLESRIEASESSAGEREDVGLVLHTSGTTSRPKIVPLSHRNMIASARNIAGTLALKSSDRCLNIMPLFHIHGLMAAVLASISAGASIVCTPGFLATQFFAWFEFFKPTWYTAVPTMHQAILLRARHNQHILARNKLRFVRSSSAALPPPVLRELEQTFAAPVIEAYGMTEAAHQMASNPLPPGDRKAGTVGMAAGPEVAIMDDAGRIVADGERGEIVVRGANIFAGYARNPQANAAAFVNGWFRTGDQGCKDSDGYVSITGRLKEIINRGGEKIAPREVDEVLLTHPAVQQAVSFAVPHPTLGEEVAAAIVLRSGQKASAQELGQFAAQHLAHFKVPQRFVLLDEIPTGPTGKLQRVGLAEKLGIGPETPVAQALDWTAAQTSSEKLVSEIWADVLRLSPEGDRPALGIHSRFLDLGGDSMLATQIAVRIRGSTRIDFPLRTLFETPTVASLAKALDTLLAMQALERDRGQYRGEEIDV